MTVQPSKYRFLLINAFSLAPGNDFQMRSFSGPKETQVYNYEDLKPFLADIDWDLSPGAPATHGNWPVTTKQEFMSVGNNRLPLVRDAGLRRRAEQVALLANAQVVAGEFGDLRKMIEQVDAFADDGDFLRIVELQPKRAGRYGRRQRAQRRPFFEHDDGEPGAVCEERGCRADDAATDDHDVSARRQRVRHPQRWPGSHRVASQTPSTGTASSSPGHGGLVAITTSSGRDPQARN